MLKEGRKPSNDPAQEKLRQGKTVWNKEVSSFINDLIHVKKLMNGWPSKYYKERSKIIAPVPVDAASILNGLASQFQELSQQGASLAQQQAEYAKNRRQKRVDQGTQTLNKLDEKYGPTESIIPPPLAPTAPAGGDLAAKLSMWEKKYELVVKGTNYVEKEFLHLAAECVAGLARLDVPDDEPAKDNYFAHAVQSAAERLSKDTEAEYEGLSRALTDSEIPKVVSMALEIGRVSKLRDHDLSANASNPFSRFLTKVKTPRIGFSDAAQRRRLRMDMLKAAVKSYRALGKMQVHITKSSKQSVVDAYKSEQEAWNEWSVVSRNFNLLVNSMPDQTTRPEDMRDEAPPGTERDLPSTPGQLHPGMIGTYEIQNIVNDIYSYGPIFRDKTSLALLKAIQDIKVKGFKTPDGTTPTAGPVAIQHLYRQLLHHLNQLKGTSGNSLAEIYQGVGIVQTQTPETKEQISAPPPPITESEPPPVTTTAQLEVVAQAFIQKWLGKTRHQLIPGSSSGLRLQVYELGSKTRKCINSVMDLLEKGFDVQQLGPRISEVSSNINTLRSLMRSLHNTEKPAPKGKNNPSAFDGIF